MVAMDLPIQHNTSLRVLVMDDEFCIRDCTKILLEELGYAVDTACSGSEAVHLFAKAAGEREPIRAVILDLTMPGGDGAVKTLPLLRQIDPDIKSILISGSHNSPEMLQPRKHGFCGKLPKPYGIAELRKIMAGLELNLAK
jgi:CheY-like chemotaxis protein